MNVMSTEQINFAEKINTGLSPTNNEQFDKKGFLFLKDFVNVEPYSELIPEERGMIKYINNKKILFDENELQVPGSVSRYNYPNYIKLHLEIQTKVENLIGKQLYPTYFYDRFYFTNQELTKHVDRDSCEISVTLNISSYTPYVWPLFIKSVDGKEHKILLDKGDAVLYKGCERPHWRESLKDTRSIFKKINDKINKKEIYYHQVFFHYVLADGIRAHFAYDTFCANS